MMDGNKITTLIDQFKAYLRSIDLSHSSFGQPYTLYSLRHFYATRMLQKGVPVYTIAKNMGTSVHIIEQYYGRSAVPSTMAATLGGVVGTRLEAESASLE